MTAEQAAENIKAKIEELASKAAERMDALTDWLDPRIRHRAVEHIVRASSSTSSSGNKSTEAEPSPIALAGGPTVPLDIPQCLPYGILARPA